LIKPLNGGLVVVFIGRLLAPGSTVGGYRMKTPSKKKRVLMALTQRSYNRFEAEQQLHDHCIHTTVSTLQNKHGIVVNREFESVPGFQGIETRVCRYWIAPENIDNALKLVQFWS
jgi:hypothetical protein